jgi:hypothetical protein
MLANNHILIVGRRVFLELNNNNITYVGAGNYLKEAIIVSIIEATGMKVAIPNFCENEWFIALGIFYQPSKEGDCYTDLIVMLIIEKRAIYLICFLQPRK